MCRLAVLGFLNLTYGSKLPSQIHSATGTNKGDGMAEANRSSIQCKIRRTHNGGCILSLSLHSNVPPF